MFGYLQEEEKMALLMPVAMQDTSLFTFPSIHLFFKVLGRKKLFPKGFISGSVVFMKKNRYTSMDVFSNK